MHTQIGNSFGVLALHARRMQNVPAFNAGEQVANAIADLRQAMDQRFDRLEQRVDRVQTEILLKLQAM